MILGCIVMIGIAGQTSQAPSVPGWATQAVSCKAAVAASRKARNAPIPSHSSTGFSGSSVVVGTVHADPLIDPERDREFEHMNETLRLVGYLEAIGDLKRTRQTLATLGAEHPRLQRYFIDHIVAVDYLLGNKKQAYADIVAEFQKPWTGGDRPWLLLAVVAASNGQVFSGQFEYCQEAIMAGSRDNHDRLAKPIFTKQPLKASDVEAAACVALVRQQIFCGCLAPAFLEKALSIDPSNIGIARLLIGMYGCPTFGCYSKARRIATAMLSKGANEDDREWLKNVLQYELNQPDRPPVRPTSPTVAP